VSFLAILWAISGPMTIPLGPWGQFTVPGYMVWVALIYAVGGTWLTFKIGRPLVRLNFDQQRYEADFRFSLVRLRENTESVAMYRGEGRELGNFTDRFTHVVDNFWSIMKRVKVLGWYTRTYDQVAVIFPFIVAAPMFFSKKMEIGGLMQTAGAFFELQVALSYLIKNYTEIAEWQSVVERLSGFDRRVREIAAAARAPQQIVAHTAGSGIEVAELELDLPDGTALLRNVGFTVQAGEALLIAGPTGTGKSTLLRAIAGIWPYGRGRIRLGQGTSLFLPQRPYLPLGTLRHAVLYPREDLAVPTARIASVLRDVGLPELVEELDSSQNWAHRLSLGEQQRLAFARVLLIQPAIVFLDEASSALDEACEAMLYRLLRAASWRPTIVSIGHRSTLRAFHDTLLDLDAMYKRRANLAVVASEPASGH
jgi:vitamin B12/bleomycin/antimicrobial peptide transport system ATP-binding/permease protein